MNGTPALTASPVVSMMIFCEDGLTAGFVVDAVRQVASMLGIIDNGDITQAVRAAKLNGSSAVSLLA
ncbi:MAG TPA: hypothetical protein VFP43_12370 [Mesorhizobium sp.]|jgi:hypothetical protein|nr:hypothetical protein [Mesorhizobium sp.]